MTEIPQPSAHDRNNRKAQKLDWRALADALDREGKHELADEMRRSGESAEAKNEQSENFSIEQFIAERNKEIDQKIAAQRNIPPPVHNPKFDANRLDTAAIEVVKNSLTPVNQNKPPSVSNTPKGPIPTGGK